MASPVPTCILSSLKYLQGKVIKTKFCCNSRNQVHIIQLFLIIYVTLLKIYKIIMASIHIANLNGHHFGHLSTIFQIHQNVSFHLMDMLNAPQSHQVHQMIPYHRDHISQKIYPNCLFGH